jgi:hypothetical protein
MDLQETTPAQVTGASAMHIGSAEPREVARLFTEPYAVLNEAGLNVAEGTPVRVHADQELLPSRRVVIVIIIIWNDGSVTIIVIGHASFK